MEQTVEEIRRRKIGAEEARAESSGEKPSEWVSELAYVS